MIHKLTITMLARPGPHVRSVHTSETLIAYFCIARPLASGCTSVACVRSTDDPRVQAHVTIIHFSLARRATGAGGPTQDGRCGWAGAYG